MKTFGLRLIACLLLGSLFLAGCQSDITLSRAVRTGDTLAVSLGDADPTGADSNLTSTMLREDDVTAVLTDTNAVAHPVTVRHVFRVYGDPTATSLAARGRAQWMAVIDLVDAGGSAPNLALGDATITLSSPTKFKADHIVNTHILSGVGSPTPSSRRTNRPPSTWTSWNSSSPQSRRS